ncbi:type III-B CRISPR module-associated Cmr3 family protein [Streptomyces sp. CNQ-509]|uniref:type III-B CRISPR module-associated Cmr3 family protein n=1 Tax=Streptomyces sp. CNQ-509 TaxID=444103 RepID=UPI000A589F45|nr:type III-B CRISPR module-associated Cmr3 family protein [Streptomyces sp. CNQ-509]
MPEVPATPAASGMLDVTVTAHQPLALGVRPAGTAPAETRSHIPGSVLRGALATVWIRDHGLPMEVSPRLREEFVALFEGDVRYGPLFGSGSGIVPLSVKRCKYRCSSDAYVDTAFADGDEPSHCGLCDEAAPLTGGRGEVEFFGSRAGKLHVERTHLEIDDDSQVARDKELFTRRALSHRESDGTHRRFHGRIVPRGLPEAAADWLVRPRKLRMGGGRSTGGGVSFATAPAHPELPETATIVVLRLLSPAALTCPSGLPLDLGDRDAVRDALNDELADLLGTPITEVSRLWARREHVGGWHAASALPKATELALIPGSVLRLAFAEPPSPEALQALTARGIGLRRNEGFGAVEVAVSGWRAPGAAGPGDAASGGQEAVPDEAESHARVLHRTGHGRWFADQLRPYAAGRMAGEPPSTAVLGRSRLRDLPDGDRDDIERMLLDALPQVLDRTLAVLRFLNTLDEEKRQP